VNFEFRTTIESNGIDIKARCDYLDFEKNIQSSASTTDSDMFMDNKDIEMLIEEILKHHGGLIVRELKKRRLI